LVSKDLDFVKKIEKMVAAHVIKVNDMFNGFLDFLPPGLILSVAAGCIENRKYWDAYIKEFIGSMMMIAFTFSAGKWIGVDNWQVAWVWHSIGVVAADYFGGGQQVNPAVTVSMWALAKCDYTEAFVRIAGQMGGGMISFPLFHIMSEALNWEPFGGPEFNKDSNVDAAISEFISMFLLMWAIYIVSIMGRPCNGIEKSRRMFSFVCPSLLFVVVLSIISQQLNWEFNFGKYHYWIKQFLTAFVIRALIEYFPTAGPAMNPMLATCWDAFGVGGNFDMPDDNNHYFVYWLAPCISAVLASVSYGIYNGDKIFGMKLPIGPLKQKKKVKKN
jgi:glycerol uptake facilitator-like aquaporin